MFVTTPVYHPLYAIFLSQAPRACSFMSVSVHYINHTFITIILEMGHAELCGSFLSTILF